VIHLFAGVNAWLGGRVGRYGSFSGGEMRRKYSSVGGLPSRIALLIIVA